MIELLEKYPKAAEVVRIHFLKKLAESLKNTKIPEEFLSYVQEQGITNNMVANLIDGQPRLLFDVFDENQIFIQINNWSENGKDETMGAHFSYLINFSLSNAFNYSSRKEAELEAVQKAFELLENKL
jgi:hypothetical protein